MLPIYLISAILVICLAILVLKIFSYFSYRSENFNGGLTGQIIQEIQTCIEKDRENINNLLFSIENIFILINKDGFIENANPSACTILEYSKKELSGMQIKNIFPGILNTGELVKKETVKTLQTIILTKSRKKIPAVFAVSIIYDYKFDLDNSISRVVSSILLVGYDSVKMEKPPEKPSDTNCKLLKNFDDLERLVPERTRESVPVQRVTLNIEEDLKNITKKTEVRTSSFYDIVKKNIDAILIVNHENRIIFVNQKAETFFAKNEKYLIGNLFEYELDINQKHEIIITPEKEDTRIGELTIMKTNWEGQSVYLVTIRDITERKEAERLKRDFINTVSHELRTPLTIIKESVSLVLDEVSGKLEEPQKKLLNMSKKSIIRLTDLINNLLDISKIEAGKLDLNKTNINIADFVKDIVLDFSYLAKENQLNLKYSFSNNNIILFIDPERIREVLGNFLSNAIKFTEKKGTIKIICNENRDDVTICVEDTGIGIDKKNIPALFDKFTQFARKAGPGIKGTGLGLAISKSIVEMHNGSIWAESEPGKGTKICFSIPKKK